MLRKAQITMPGLNDRGKSLDQLCEDLRNSSVLTRTCSHCGFTVEGKYTDTREPMRKHLLKKHGKVARPKRGRSGFVADTDLEDNLRRSRVDGSSVDYTTLDP